MVYPHYILTITLCSGTSSRQQKARRTDCTNHSIACWPLAPGRAGDDSGARRYSRRLATLALTSSHTPNIQLPPSPAARSANHVSREIAWSQIVGRSSIDHETIVHLDWMVIQFNCRILGFDGSPVGLSHRPVGMDDRPVRMEDRLVGMEDPPVGMEDRPVGMDDRPLELDHRQVSLDVNSIRLDDCLDVLHLSVCFMRLIHPFLTLMICCLLSLVRSLSKYCSTIFHCV